MSTLPTFQLIAALFAMSAPAPDALPPHAAYVVDTDLSESDCMAAVLAGAIPSDALAAEPDLARAAPAPVIGGRFPSAAPRPTLRVVLYCEPAAPAP